MGPRGEKLDKTRTSSRKEAQATASILATDPSWALLASGFKSIPARRTSRSWIIWLSSLFRGVSPLGISKMWAWYQEPWPPLHGQAPAQLHVAGSLGCLAAHFLVLVLELACWCNYPSGKTDLQWLYGPKAVQGYPVLHHACTALNGEYVRVVSGDLWRSAD